MYCIIHCNRYIFASSITDNYRSFWLADKQKQAGRNALLFTKKLIVWI